MVVKLCTNYLQGLLNIDCWASPWSFCLSRFGVGLEYLHFSQIRRWWQCCWSGEKTVWRRQFDSSCALHREMQPTGGEAAGRRPGESNPSSWIAPSPVSSVAPHWWNSASSQKTREPIDAIQKVQPLGYRWEWRVDVEDQMENTSTSTPKYLQVPCPHYVFHAALYF